jgi:glycosyltransferase involved in cell wall biosynthesis
MKRTLGAARAAGRWVAIASSRPARAEVAVFYGHRRVPAPGERVEGGMVKFQRLQTAFPNRPRDFNLLYLGSSTLPNDVRTLLRLGRRRGAVVVVNQDGVAYPAWAGPRAEQVNARLRTVLEAADHVLYQSRFCKETADLFLGQPTGEWELLPNAVDTASFTPAARAPEGDPVILLAGDQFQPYRVPTALRTLAVLPEARLLVTGKLVGDCRGLAAELGVGQRVELVGPYAQREAPALYRRAHVLLHPKVNDPCPNVVLEAMACGVPVVHSATGGTPELVGEAGVGVPSETTLARDVPPDPEGLAQGVRTVLARLDAYRAAARGRAVERFDLGPWVERHRELFGSLVGGP